MPEIWVYNRKKSRWQLPHDVTEQISEIVCSKSLWCDGCHSANNDVIIRGGMNTKRSLKRPEGGWDSHSNDMSVVILLLCNNLRRKGRKWHVERKLELPINFRKQIWFSPKGHFAPSTVCSIRLWPTDTKCKTTSKRGGIYLECETCLDLSTRCSTFTLQCSELIWEPPDKLQLCQIMSFGMFGSEAYNLGELAMFSVTLFYFFLLF